MDRVKAAEKLLANREVVGGCWRWTGLLDQGGYGDTRFEGSRWKAHVLAYVTWVGERLPAHVLDHTCHTLACPGGRTCPHRRCFNPDHLEQVSPAENNLRSQSPSAMNARKTHCPRNHEYTPENTRIEAGSRVCRTCRNSRQMEHYYAQRDRAV